MEYTHTIVNNLLDNIEHNQTTRIVIERIMETNKNMHSTLIQVIMKILTSIM